MFLTVVLGLTVAVLWICAVILARRHNPNSIVGLAIAVGGTGGLAHQYVAARIAFAALSAALAVVWYVKVERQRRAVRG